MSFDKAHEGDTVFHCKQTFGLRPAEELVGPTKVVAVETTYYGQRVTIEDGTVLLPDMHHMHVVKKAG